MVKCVKCGKEIEKCSASISGGILGDEYIDALFFCDKCQVYTKEVTRDRFCGPETSDVRGDPISKAEGDAQVKLIKKCTRPWDKKCRCPAHKEYFGNALD